MRLPLLILVLLAACSRPLTTAGQALTARIHGPSLDTPTVRLTRTPLVGLFPFAFDARPLTTAETTHTAQPQATPPLAAAAPAP